jgi:hypothetical protein
LAHLASSANSFWLTATPPAHSVRLGLLCGRSRSRHGALLSDLRSRSRHSALRSRSHHGSGPVRNPLIFGQSGKSFMQSRHPLAMVPLTLQVVPVEPAVAERAKGVKAPLQGTELKPRISPNLHRYTEGPCCSHRAVCWLLRGLHSDRRRRRTANARRWQRWSRGSCGSHYGSAWCFERRVGHKVLRGGLCTPSCVVCAWRCTPPRRRCKGVGGADTACAVFHGTDAGSRLRGILVLELLPLRQR